MQVERYEEGKHLEMIKTWFIRRGFPPLDKKYLPRLGYVVKNAVAWFFYEDKFCPVVLGDNFVMNPDCPGKILKKAVDALNAFIWDELKALGYEIFFTYTNEKTLLKRAEKHWGLTKHSEGHSLFVRIL
jgi:hypothetical protein